MHYSFAASILYNNPAKLENLTLDNLQQVGSRCDHFLYRLANQRQDYLQTPSTWNQMVHQYGFTTPFGPAGPMQNILGPLAGRCPNLRTLTLRKVGQWRRTEFTPEFAAKDEDICELPFLNLCISFSSCLGGRRPFPSCDTCLLTLETSYKKNADSKIIQTANLPSSSTR